MYKCILEDDALTELEFVYFFNYAQKRSIFCT